MWNVGVYLYDTYQRLCIIPTATDTVAHVLYICVHLSVKGGSHRPVLETVNKVRDLEIQQFTIIYIYHSYKT